MRFEEYRIAPEIKRNLETLNFKRPTDIQYKAIPHVLQGEDVLAIAQTGTGKTAAFAIPVLHVLQKQKSSSRAEGVKCLVLEPTRELAVQITEAFQQLAKHTRVKISCLMGGVDQQAQVIRLEKGTDVVVATPGRMFDLISQGHLDLDAVEILILDEADHMLDLGFLHDIKQLTKMLPRKRQTLFFSATIDEKIKKLAYSLVNKPIRIQVSPKDPVAKNIEHAVAFVAMDDKRFFLERILTDHPESKTLVFVRTKIRAERVAKALERMKIESRTIHSDKEQRDRLQVMEDFRSGTVKVLVATDVSARGIDIPDVDFVVNYDLPEQPENYVHRVGRTGRGKKKGQAIAFCSEEEKPLLEEIESYISKPVTVLEVSKQDYRETLAATDDTTDDWRSLMREEENQPKSKKRKKKKK